MQANGPVEVAQEIESKGFNFFQIVICGVVAKKVIQSWFRGNDRS